MLALFGRFLADMDRVRVSSDSRDRGNVLFAVGLAIVVIGSIGVFFGRLIKAGVFAPAGVPGRREQSSIHAQCRGPRSRVAQDRRAGRRSRRADRPPARRIAVAHVHGAGPPELRRRLAGDAPAAGGTHQAHLRTSDGLPAGPRAHGRVASACADAPSWRPCRSRPDRQPHQPLRRPKPPPEPRRRRRFSPVMGPGRRGWRGGGCRRRSDGRSRLHARSSSGLLERVESLGLRPALSDKTGAQLLVLGLLIDQEQTMAVRQEGMVAQAFGPDASAQVEAVARRRRADARGAGACRWSIWRCRRCASCLPPRARALARAGAHADRGRRPGHLARVSPVHGAGSAPGGRGAAGGARARYVSLRDLAAEARLVLSLIAAVRMPQAPAQAYRAGAQLLEGIDAEPVGARRARAGQGFRRHSIA